ncbi:MAG: hypothetical protein QOE68_3413 [Thermoanaerobaculia bacterium]|nr:hypothetical protein [Thermoanaerobaculia bacterium]
MDANTRTRIRHIFLSPRPHFPLNTVAELLEMSVEELKAEIKDGGIVAVSTAVGVRVTREEMVAAAMGRWEVAVIERALGRRRRGCCRRRSGSSSCGRAFLSIRKRCCGIRRGRSGRPSARSSRASWRTWRRRVPRSWRRRCRRWQSRCSLRAGDPLLRRRFLT